MSALRDFVADVLVLEGAAVEPVEPDGLDVLAPAALAERMGWPELARLGFGAALPSDSIPIGLEGDFLDRFGTLLGERGRWVERQLMLPTSMAPLADPARVLERALDLPNAVWRFHAVTATWTRCLLLTFRYTAMSDEKRDGLVRVGFNLGTGAVLDEVLARLRLYIAAESDWQAPEPEVRLAAGPGWDAATLERRVRPLLDVRVREALEPFLRAMRSRLERDRNRVHRYHDDLRGAALKRLAALGGAEGEKAEAQRRRETSRVAAIEREYRAKLDDLRHNYALRLKVDWVQALELYLPVQRIDVQVRRRKGERLIRLDWHRMARLAEPPPCDWGLGLDRVRLVCDDQLHLTEAAGQAPCASCGKAFCRACHPVSCPRCGTPVHQMARPRAGLDPATSPLRP